MWIPIIIAGLILLGGAGAGLAVGSQLARIKPLLVMNPAEQWKMAALIYSRFLRAGLGNNIALAAVINAYAESRLDPSVVAGRQPWSANAGAPFAGGAGENSVGLFQLNAAPGAAGAGMTVAERQNPENNIARIIQVVKSRDGDPLTNNKTASIGRLTNLFTTEIERPADRARKGALRETLANQVFG